MAGVLIAAPETDGVGVVEADKVVAGRDIDAVVATKVEDEEIAEETLEIAAVAEEEAYKEVEETEALEEGREVEGIAVAIGETDVLLVLVTCPAELAIAKALE